VLVVTGGCGMIGSNLIAALNRRGVDDILVVDDLRNSAKFHNIADLRIADYQDRERFMARLHRGDTQSITAIFHQGACTDTMEADGRLMMALNYEASRDLLEHALVHRIPFVYASSAAVYGLSAATDEDPANEHPLNIYAYSKKLFDDHVRRVLGSATSPIAGLRYFNVYGPHEAHKGRMSSVALRLYSQIRAGEKATIFGAYGGMGPGEHRRDFVHVEDVAEAILWVYTQAVSGIFNCGTGSNWSFRELAEAAIAVLGRGEVEFQPFPPALAGKYQSVTRADLSRLRAAGCDLSFRDLPQGIRDYYAWLDRSAS
jgi:ADP-L-glycero-D-manno-heptose 6-epimerase